MEFWRGEKTICTRRDYVNENYAHFDALEAGICSGMSVAWLRGILLEDRQATHMPNIDWAVYLQGAFQGENPEVYASCADLQSCYGTSYDSYKDALEYIYNQQDPEIGYFIIARKSWRRKHADNRHAVAFQWQDDRAYTMMPNSGLFRCDNAEDLINCFDMEHPMSRWVDPVVTIFEMSYN